MAIRQWCVLLGYTCSVGYLAYSVCFINSTPLKVCNRDVQCVCGHLDNPFIPMTDTGSVKTTNIQLQTALQVWVRRIELALSEPEGSSSRLEKILEFWSVSILESFTWEANLLNCYEMLSMFTIDLI